MKKSLLNSILIVLLSATSVLGDFGQNCPPDNVGTKENYTCRRFVRINYGDAKYLVDLKDVSAVYYDFHGHINKIEKWPSGYDKSYSIFYKNGKFLYAGHASSVYTYFENYIKFINAHPEFLNMP